MTDRALIIIRTVADRARAIRWIDLAPVNSRVTFQRTKRTIPQNARLHAMITDVAEQKRYHGLKLSLKDWKLLFMDALNQEVRMVPNLAGTGFISLGRSTADLSVAECGDLMEVISAWGAENGVVFSEPAETGGSAPMRAAGMAPGETHSTASQGTGVKPNKRPEAGATEPVLVEREITNV